MISEECFINSLLTKTSLILFAVLIRHTYKKNLRNTLLGVTSSAAQENLSFDSKRKIQTKSICIMEINGYQQG